MLWQDSDLRRGVLVVRVSKTHEAREVPLTGAVKAALAIWAKHQEIVPVLRPEPVLGGLAAILPASVTKRFQTVARRTGFPALRLHDLRHAFCSRLAQRGTPIPTISRLAGRRSLQTTMRYAEHHPAGATQAAIAGLEAPAAPERRGGPEGGPSEFTARKSAP